MSHRANMQHAQSGLPVLVLGTLAGIPVAILTPPVMTFLMNFFGG